MNKSNPKYRPSQHRREAEILVRMAEIQDGRRIHPQAREGAVRSMEAQIKHDNGEDH